MELSPTWEADSCAATQEFPKCQATKLQCVIILRHLAHSKGNIRKLLG
jgi:hypothetical protein